MFLTGCPSSSACTPGRVESCPCIGGTMGVQTCQADSTFGPCTCGTTDAGPGVDAAHDDSGIPGNDAGTDAAIVMDDAGTDDAATTTDAGHDAAVVGTDSGSGTIHGHAVMLGYDAMRTNDSVDTFIGNAVFVSERPATGPLRVLDYQEYAQPGTGTHLHDLIDAAATARGRTVTHTLLADTSATGYATALASADVLVIHPSPLVSGYVFSTQGMDWHDATLSFLDAGGVVVVLMNTSNISGIWHQEWMLAAGTGLFNAVTDPYESGGSTGATEIISPPDAIGTGVLSPFSIPESMCLNMMSGGSPIARYTDPSASFCPTARHIVR